MFVRLLPVFFALPLVACGGSEPTEGSGAAATPGANDGASATDPESATTERGSLSVTLGELNRVSTGVKLVQAGRWGADGDLFKLVLRGDVEGDFEYQVGGPHLEYRISMRPEGVGEHPFRHQVRNTSNDGVGVALQITGPDMPVLNVLSGKGTLNVTECVLEGDTNETLVVKRFAATFSGEFKQGDQYGDGATGPASGSIEYTR